MQPAFEKFMRRRAASVMSLPDDLDDATLVASLARPTRSEDAYWLLMSRGASAIPALKDGLCSPEGLVRYQCCRVLDHYVTEDVAPALVAMLDDDDPRVVCQVLHSLTCERCKEGECRPDAEAVFQGARRLLRDSAFPIVRSLAAEVVGAEVHARPAALVALQSAREDDPSPMVRKKVTWYLPGGPIFDRTAPKAKR